MNDDSSLPIEPEEEIDLPASYALTEGGWEAVGFVEPGPDWRVTEDGAYESPDGRFRTQMAADPVEWPDATKAD